MRHAVIAIVAVIAIATGLWKLNSARDGVDVAATHSGTTPVTVFKPASAARAPVIVIAHGFAGSQQLMQPFALTLARNGYVAVTFDFLGHGRKAAPLPGGLVDQNASLRALLAQLNEVVAFARTLPSGDGRLALLGHSMASDIVVRHAMTDPAIAATIAVSVFAPDVTATSPRNLLVIDGALEPSFLKDEGFRIVGQAANGAAKENTTYGNFADGTARRLVFAQGVEHIGVLYSADSMAAALDWANGVFARSGDGFTDVRGRWLGLLYLGLIALAWPLARCLPQVAPEPMGAGYRWRRLLPLAILPAILTPLILWKLPTSFLPLLLGDYLALHFGVYGLLTLAGLLVVRRRDPASALRPFSATALIVATTACTAYAVLAIGIPADRFITNFMPTPERWLLMPVIMAGTILFFVADEWLTRGATAPRGSYIVTKIFFLLSLAAAIGLNPQKLFFLIIIVPAILVFFLIYGLFSTWAYRRTGHPLAGALSTAIAIAWAVAVTFPIVAR